MSMIAALRNNRAQFNEDLFYHQALISSIDDVIISTDRTFVIKTWNAAAEKVYQIAAEEAIGCRMSDLSYHQYVDTTEEQAQKQLVQEDYWKGIVKVITGSGKTTFLHSVITTVRDSKQKKIGYVGVSRNINRDISTRQSLQNFESILTMLDESFLIVDKNLRIVFMCLKGNAQKFFNSDYKSGDNALKYIPPVYTSIVERSYKKALSGEIVNYNAVSETKPKLYFSVTYAPLKDNIGNVTNACLTIKDLTAQKEMELLQKKKTAVEKNLFESRKFFEDFMENSPLPAWVTDDDGYIQYMNSAYLDSYGFTKEMFGKHMLELYSTEIAEEYFINNKKVIETGNVIEAIEKANESSQSKTYKIIKFPIVFKGRTMVAGWGIDISDEIATQESLLLLNQNKNRIMSVIAHDIRAPLGTNSNFIDTIIQDYKTFEEEELLQYLNMMQQSLTKCFRLTDDLLLWARNQLQTISYNPVALEADVEITKIVENLIPIAEDKKIAIETQFCFSRKIYGDPDMFAIVLRNLISNAIKFSTSGSTILVSTKAMQGKLMIRVKDNGVGMKKELAEKILRKLNYESSFGTKGEKGAGLGLIIAKDYIERNNGEMYIESVDGEGSIFSFTISFVEH